MKPNNGNSPLNALAAQARAGLQPQTSTTLMAYVGGKLAQWDPMPRALAVLEPDRQRYHLIARTIPLQGDPVNKVRDNGRMIFEAAYGNYRRKFEAEIAAAELEVQRLSHERARVADELEKTPPTILTEPNEPRIPNWFSPRWWAVVLLAVCFCLSAFGAVSNIVMTLLPFTQALLPAIAVSSVWVLLSVALKVATQSIKTPLRTLLHWAIALVGVIGGVLWLTGLTSNYAGQINLNDNSGILSHSRALPFCGQLLCELAVGYACLSGVLALLSHPSEMALNPDREVLFRRLGKLNQDARHVLVELSQSQGNLLKYEASREAFEAEGVAIICLRQAAAPLVAENQRLLEQFSEQSKGA